MLLLFIAGMYNIVRSQNIDSIRYVYFSMDQKECAWELVMDKVAGAETPLLLAYEGASLAASAQCQKGAMKKLKRFKEGKEKLEKAVNLMPENTEIRFLRYSVKVKTPDILSYKDDGVDEHFILQRLSADINEMDDFLLKEICSFLLEHGNLNENDRQMVQELYQI